MAKFLICFSFATLIMALILGVAAACQKPIHIVIRSREFRSSLLLSLKVSLKRLLRRTSSFIAVKSKDLTV